MTHKIAINGFGRIGRQVFRILEGVNDIEVVAINDLTAPEMSAHLLRYDSVHGRFDGDVKVVEGGFNVNGRFVHVTAERDPSNLKWGEHEAEVVLECTGIFRSKEKVQPHLDAGAKWVVISAPGQDVDLTVVMGVNDHLLDPSVHKVVSNGSCTTNCLAPVVKVIDDTFGVDHGLMTTIHSYTNDQSLLDLPHKDKRRARAAAMSMIPSTTGAAAAIGLVLPHLAGKLDGMAVRVPTPNVSLVDVVLRTQKPCDAESVNAALKEAADGSLKGVLGFEEDELVSTDYIGDPRSSIVDAANTTVMNGHSVKLLSWYDNEWGFSNRMIDLTRKLLS
jgi:glyceraldehyde 3-phosphate dehydrogenase